MDAFDRLTPALQYQIVNGLGWKSLRPVQERAIEAVLAGENAVILAPTAGGKTEAALFPLLSLMDAEDRRPVSVLYIAPLRALLNNQEPRLHELAGLVGRRAFKWHGDVGQSGRRRFADDLADVLAITPESLEALLLSSSMPARRILANIQAVVVDEVHGFAAGDRGGHLMAVLERVARICGRDIQRIGLSATVGNPAEICAWMSGSSSRNQSVVDPGGVGADPELSLDYVGTLENAAIVIERLHPGRKRLVFADSRRRVEELGHLLAQRGVETHVTHSSLSASERQAAERAFEQGNSCVIVATSALELGIDVGDLDHVLQIDAPAVVSSFLQRMGRTGRRPGSVPNCTFLCTSDDSLLQAAALLQLHDRGFVEPVSPARRGAHLLAHQLMALTLQHSGIAAGEWWSFVAGAAPFTGLDESDRAELVETMLGRDILCQVDGRLVLGDRGQKLYGGKNFLDLYVVFSTPSALRVMWGPQEIGTIDVYFAHIKEPEELSFVLGGKPWRAIGIDWRRATCHVEPSKEAGLPMWMGAPRLLSAELCQAMKMILVQTEVDPRWSRRATEQLDGLRQENTFLHGDPLPITEAPGELRWWTYAGGKANNTLAPLLQLRLGGKVTANNIALAFSGQAARSQTALRQALRELREEDALRADNVRRFAAGLARGRISKFQPCLSERLELELLAETLMDVEGAARTIRGCC